MASLYPGNLSNAALSDEIEAINSIYGDGTLVFSSHSLEDAIQCSFRLPNQPFTFLITFPSEYPARPPEISGTQSTGTRGKGEVSTGTNHLGFRCVMTREQYVAQRRQTNLKGS